MSLIAKIKEQQINARKNKKALEATLLTTLIGESEAVGKNQGNRESTDSEVVSVVKKFIKNIDDTISVLAKNPETNQERIQNANQEKTILVAFLPAQLNAEQITEQMTKLAQELGLKTPKDMGVLMKEFKARFEGQFDGGVASQTAKKVLS